MDDANFPNFNRIITLDDAGVRALSLETMAALQADLIERAVLLKRDREVFQKVANLRFSAPIAIAYQGKDSGTATLLEDTVYLVRADRKKEVKWDQKFLLAEIEAIKAQGDDPTIYIKPKTTYSIGEAVWKAWPDKMRDHFMLGRTVEVGPTVITIEVKKT